MKMKDNGLIQELINKLKGYKKKYYKNKLIKGTIIALALIVSAFLFVNSLEYSLRFNSSVRTFLFFAFIGLFAFILIRYIIDPLQKIYSNKRQISNEAAAKQLGKYFPEISDKLLNTLQLNQLTAHDNELIKASIAQKANDLSIVPFGDAINLNENKKFLKYLFLPTFVLIVILLFEPSVVTNSSNRIINFNKEFVPEAPFTFELLNDDLLGFKNEDFTVRINVNGNAIPDQVYVVKEGRKIKMDANGTGQFEHTFSKVQRSIDFTFEGAGYFSQQHTLSIVSRPNLRTFNVFLNYPAYIGKKDERVENVGNLTVPEGTEIKWQFNTQQSDVMAINFTPDNEVVNATKVNEDVFELDKTVKQSFNYQLQLKNQYSNNKDNIEYTVEAIQDKYPTISLEQFQDTTLYQYMILGGNITDDYGLSRLKVFYRITDNGNAAFQSLAIPINRNQNSQSYYFNWQLDSLNLKEGNKLEYYLQVWDNDGYNGSKSSKTGIYSYNVPTKANVKENIDKTTANTEKQINKTLEKAKDLKDKLKKAEERLKGNKTMNWQDEKLLEQLIKEKEEINKEIQKLKEQNRANIEKRNRFNEPNKQIQEKVDKLQQLMDELLDDETKKLYEELQKLLEEQRNINEFQDVLEELNNKEENLENELERTLEMFKRMKMEFKLEEVINELDDLTQKQEQLAEDTPNKENDLQDLQEQQEQLNQEFNDLQEELNELEELNQELEDPEPLQDTEGQEKSIEQSQKDSKEQLGQKKRKKASDSQKKASDKMKQLSQQLQQMQSNMEMQMLEENIDNLKDIVDNLVKLSFDQEDLIKGFRNVNQSDPRFVDLSQQQLKLKDDAIIVEDSLMSLAKRVFQIESFITREVTSMKNNIEDALTSLRERNKGMAMGKQQFAMTSINNLAILLDDVLQQMQQQMADAMGAPQKGDKKQKGKSPSMSQLQQQLNQKIQDLKKSGKSGRQLSEELADMISQQEQLRKSLQEMKQKLGDKEGKEGGAGGNLDEVIDKMEDTELDLANKKITQETIERQKEILTRLLEAEDALRERELDEKREAKTAQDYEKAIPKAFEEYILNKEKELELLKTIPVKLNPYYKKEVNEYFNRIKSN